MNIIPWTIKEKTTAITFFKKHIDLKKVPNKKECEDLIKLSPSLFLNKIWRKIKYFIHNYINSKKIKLFVVLYCYNNNKDLYLYKLI